MLHVHIIIILFDNKFLYKKYSQNKTCNNNTYNVKQLTTNTQIHQHQYQITYLYKQDKDEGGNLQ